MSRASTGSLWKRGEVVIESIRKDSTIEIDGGLVHDWVGAVFIAGATLEQTLSFVQNYNNHKNIYKPEVIDSKLRSRDGNDFKIHLRLLKKKVLTVVLNTEHDVTYYPVSGTRAYSRSYSRKIAEVENAAGP